MSIFRAATEEEFRDLMLAASRDQPSFVMNLLLAGVDPNQADALGNTPLHKAIMEESERVVKLLIEHPHADVNALNQAGETPVMLAALRGRLRWVQALVQRGALINEAGFTALHYACSGPDNGVTAWLVSQGAELDARSPNGSTPLMMAAGYGSPDSADILLQAGADASLRNDKGLSAIDFARQAGRPELVKRLLAAQRGPYPY
ncbi:ankyrin repeat domain-containing protein [Mitsuaria sp. WAJ17]|uniref:ankyrin repeat domain-containing protein n=1 Tax=Mitsuaria sp. WAJ17 TaxID=2761452 RepID=UPI0016024CCC|nr:ankyrin repeat domain-containing protein [Mitsuaria sp. WAJ17]MBB2486364.1 ankyrin repeat domain-containing protein [Mitsuaria sp. WAJ17]